ncbi:MAG: NADPH-dependent F420 reductase [Acidimicrobiales bacterium]
MMESVGILGGTGPAGRGVALRMASCGYRVVLGSRDAERASAVAAGMKLRGEGSVHGDTNDVAAQCDLIVVATPFDSAIATVKTLRPALAGKIVISMVNALAREAREMVPLYPSRGSMAAQIAHALPDSLIVGAFHHLPASMMEDLDSGLDADVVIFSDDDGARVRVAEIVDAMPGLHAVIAGSMSLASPIEAFTAVCISVNIRHKAHSYVKLAGLQH